MLNRINRLKILLNLSKKVNKLVTFEKNKELLINNIVEMIISNDGYIYSLIIVLDECKKYKMHFEAGEISNKDKIIEEMKDGNFPECLKNTFDICSYFPDVENRICKECFIINKVSNQKIKLFKLESNGFLHGVMLLCAEKELIDLENETNIISELSQNLGYILQGFEPSEQKNPDNDGIFGNANLYKTITDNIRDGLIVTEEGKILFVNRKISEIFGLTSSEMINNSIDELLGSENIKLIDEYDKSRISEDLEFWIRRKDEKVKYIRYKSATIRNFKNHKLIIITNITGKKKNEEKLLLQYEYFKQLFENSPLGIVILDNKTRIIQSNKGFEKMFFYSSADTKGKYLKDLIMPEELRSKANSLERMLVDGKKIYEETIRIRKDNSIINVERLCYPIIINNKVTGLCVIYYDITERKKAEIAMKSAKEKAEQSEKLKSDFLAQMSHEIRTPINSMLNFINLIREEVEDGLSEDLKSAFYYIDNGSRRLIRTIDLILNMSQVQNNIYVTELINLDLFQVIIKPIFNEFVNTAKDKLIYFNLKCELEQSEVCGDYYTLSQSFQNLIDNAIKFTKTGGVDVVIYRNENNLICVDVKDTGIGISENYLTKLFEPFTQEDTGYTRRYEGNGLGLALVKKYIEINKAAISVKSEKGVGSTFTITFAT